jgi:hypothetical protein
LLSSRVSQFSYNIINYSSLLAIDIYSSISEYFHNLKPFVPFVMDSGGGGGRVVFVVLVMVVVLVVVGDSVDSGLTKNVDIWTKKNKEQNKDRICAQNPYKYLFFSLYN